MSEYHIFHSVNRWLPDTSGWIYDQISLFDLKSQTVLADSETGSRHFDVNVIFKNRTFLNKVVHREFRSRVLKKNKAHRKILFSHFGNRGWLDRHIAPDVRIVRFYGYDLHRLPYENSEWFERYQNLFEKCDLLLTEGPFMQGLLEQMGCPMEKIKVLPLGVDKPLEYDSRIIVEHVKILIAGAFKEKKGILTALEICLRLHSEDHLPLEIHLVGDEINATESDKIYAGQIGQLIHSTPLKNLVVRHGFVSRNQLKNIARKCHLALQPSQWAKDRDCEGGYPVAFLDLMSTGLPIVSTHHCDIPFIINNENGALSDENDLEGLMTNVKQLVNESLAAKSTAAFLTVKERFNWEVLKPLYTKTILMND